MVAAVAAAPQPLCHPSPRTCGSWRWPTPTLPACRSQLGWRSRPLHCCRVQAAVVVSPAKCALRGPPRPPLGAYTGRRRRHRRRRRCRRHCSTPRRLRSRQLPRRRRRRRCRLQAPGRRRHSPLPLPSSRHHCLCLQMPPSLWRHHCHCRQVPPSPWRNQSSRALCLRVESLAACKRGRGPLTETPAALRRRYRRRLHNCRHHSRCKCRRLCSRSSSSSQCPRRARHRQRARQGAAILPRQPPCKPRRPPPALRPRPHCRPKP
jgi:hypothetical protein